MQQMVSTMLAGHQQLHHQSHYAPTSTTVADRMCIPATTMVGNDNIDVNMMYAATPYTRAAHHPMHLHSTQGHGNMDPCHYSATAPGFAFTPAVQMMIQA